MIRENIPSFLSQLDVVESKCREMRSVFNTLDGALTFFEKEQIPITSEDRSKVLSTVQQTVQSFQDDIAVLNTIYKSVEVV